jgi:hypothetical protein
MDYFSANARLRQKCLFYFLKSILSGSKLTTILSFILYVILKEKKLCKNGLQMRACANLFRFVTHGYLMANRHHLNQTNGGTANHVAKECEEIKDEWLPPSLSVIEGTGRGATGPLEGWW